MTKTYMGMPVVLDETFDPDRWDLVRTPEGDEHLEVGSAVFGRMGEVELQCMACKRTPHLLPVPQDVDIYSGPFCWACGLNEYGSPKP
jgi:hypothetical protein